MPDQANGFPRPVFGGDPDLVQSELAVLVQLALGGDPAAGLVVLNFDGAIPCPDDAVHDALHHILPRLIEVEGDPLLQPQGLVGIEGVMAAIEVAQAAHPQGSVEIFVEPRLDDSDALRVVLGVEIRVVAADHLLELGELLPADEFVKAFEDFVDALAHESFHALAVLGEAEHVAEFEFFSAVFESREPGMAVDLCHRSPWVAGGPA